MAANEPGSAPPHFSQISLGHDGGEEWITSRRQIRGWQARSGLIEMLEARRSASLSGWRALPEATPLYAVYPHQRHLPAKVRSFIDFLAQRFAAQSGWDGGT